LVKNRIELGINVYLSPAETFLMRNYKSQNLKTMVNMFVYDNKFQNVLLTHLNDYVMICNGALRAGSV
ncbi:hypothetical protein, partial [Ruminococcus flavefaciens]|uniref:hypothetical protein n=1 Tax=Ruminococcus flavefaciens TaxID=1265 RepID=UPI0026EB86EB